MKKYKVTGMSCAACQARVEKAVSGVEGVSSCSVSLLTNSMGIEGSASDNDIIKAVEKAGYGAEVMEDLQLDDRESPVLAKRLISSIIILIFLMYLSMGHMMWGWPIPGFLENHVTIAVVEMILAIVVMVINKKFFISGFRSLFSGAPNMDTLVALGSTASFGYSLVELIIMGKASSSGDMDTVMKYAMNLYFESAAMIPTLIIVGKLLEAKSKGRTTDALKSLMQLAPKKATVLRDKEVVVDIEEVKVDDIYILRTGDRVPVDGVIIEGNAAIDESALTGESIPVDKEEGDTVSAGTIISNGFLKCSATRVGEDTTLSQIIQMVGDAAATKAPLARIADKVSAIFVPVVMGLAVLTFIGWMIAGESVAFGIARAISVLVISCPCALGLATPVAIMVGNGMGARNGILYKTAEAMETIGRVGVVVMDKTGTITKGEPGVTNVIPAEGVSSEGLITLAYSLEKMSEHPLAGAVVRCAEKNNSSGVMLTNFETLSGAGVKAEAAEDYNISGVEIAKGTVVQGGSYKYIKEQLELNKEKNVDIEKHKDSRGLEQKSSIKDSVEESINDSINDSIKDLSRQANELTNSGKTPLFFMVGDRFLGIIAVADQIKEDSKQAIQELSNMGIYSIMLTGDNHNTAKVIAEEVGVNEVIAEVMPDEKEKIIRSLQEIMLTDKGSHDKSSKKEHSKSLKVAMVGDGINDAVALTRADSGLAIGAGTDVAVDAADIVLVKSSIRDVAAAIRMSRATIRNIHENLFWAFFYNALCIPLAMGLYGIALKPMYGAAAMACSSVFVCLNALRLNLVKVYNGDHDKAPKRFSDQSFRDKIKTVVNEMKTNIEPENIKPENVKPENSKPENIKGETIMEKTINIEGMMCTHCEATVKKALEALDGVDSAIVSHEKGTAVVSFSQEVADEVLTKAVEDKDYKVIAIK